MSYQSMVEMASSASLLTRIVAAAADEGIADPLQWAQSRIWHLASADGWAEAWDYARATANDDVNPDTGRRPGVITDDMIRTVVQALNPPPQAAAAPPAEQQPAATTVYPSGVAVPPPPSEPVPHPSGEPAPQPPAEPVPHPSGETPSGA